MKQVGQFATGLLYFLWKLLLLMMPISWFCDFLKSKNPFVSVLTFLLSALLAIALLFQLYADGDEKECEK
jgi:hypothetical protein